MCLWKKAKPQDERQRRRWLRSQESDCFHSLIGFSFLPSFLPPTTNIQSAEEGDPPPPSRVNNKRRRRHRMKKRIDCSTRLGSQSHTHKTRPQTGPPVCTLNVIRLGSFCVCVSLWLWSDGSVVIVVVVQYKIKHNRGWRSTIRRQKGSGLPKKELFSSTFSIFTALKESQSDGGETRCVLYFWA